MRLRILYEDNHLIVVYKPAGMLVQGDHSGDPCLMDEVKNYLKEKYKKPGNVFLGMVHRLDRPVCGVVLFAKTSKGASRISKQFREHTVQKVYHALVEGIPKIQKGTLVHFIKKDTQKNKVEVFDVQKTGALRAELDYEVVETQSKTSLLKILLKTGRPHQIRSQLSYMGHPIVGDVKYGAKKVLALQSKNQKYGMIALCATSLTFQLATVDEKKTVSVEVPVTWDTLL